MSSSVLHCHVWLPETWLLYAFKTLSTFVQYYKAYKAALKIINKSFLKDTFRHTSYCVHGTSVVYRMPRKTMVCFDCEHASSRLSDRNSWTCQRESSAASWCSYNVLSAPPPQRPTYSPLGDCCSTNIRKATALFLLCCCITVRNLHNPHRKNKKQKNWILICDNAINFNSALVSRFFPDYFNISQWERSVILILKNLMHRRPSCIVLMNGIICSLSTLTALVDKPLSCVLSRYFMQRWVFSLPWRGE